MAVSSSKPVSPRPSSTPRALRRRDGGWVGAGLSLLLWLAVAAILALIAAGRVLSAPPMPIAAGIVFLPYLAALLAAVVVLAWILFPDRRSIPVALLGLGTIAAATWGPRWKGRAAAVEGEPVRVMSWNLRRLWGGPDDGGDVLACTVKTITDTAPDVLTLLEVSANDVQTLSKAMPGLKCIQHAYQRVGGEKEAKTGGLAVCTTGEGWQLRRGEGQRYVDHENWFYVFAEVARGDKVFNVLGVHLSPYRYVAKKVLMSVEELRRGEHGKVVDRSNEVGQVVQGQADQSAALLDRVDRFADPTLVAGDFNSTRDSALHAQLRRKLQDTWETGGLGFGGTVELFEMLPLRIDYIYASREFYVQDAKVLASGCSDHRPVVTNLILTR